MEQPTAPGKCVDCGNDAFIRLTSDNGREDMICGHCYADRIRSGATQLKKPHATEAAKVPRRG